MHMRTIPGLSTTLLVFLLASLQGCTAASDGDAAPQIVARVNHAEISRQRLDSALGDVHEVDQHIRRTALDLLIEEELAAQAGEDTRLDRKPEVAQAIATARSKILAQAWLDQLAREVEDPDAAEVTRYYAEHPELFERRRAYTLQQLRLPAYDGALLHALEQRIEAGASMQQLARFLDSRKVRYASEGGTRLAEQIAPEILGPIVRVGSGQTLLIRQEPALMIVRVLSSTAQPMTLVEAVPRIRKFLTNQAWTAAVDMQMRRLKQEAKISYLGEFAPAPSRRKAARNTHGDLPGPLGLLERKPS